MDAAPDNTLASASGRESDDAAWMSDRFFDCVFVLEWFEQEAPGIRRSVFTMSFLKKLLF